MPLASKRATYQDVLDAPPECVAELIHGTLHTSPRPAMPHIQAATVLGEELGPPFKRGKGGPGGWILLDEPELHLGPEPDVLVPDLAGWRREKLPELPEGAYLTVSPDWVAEVLSPATRRHDRMLKVPIYQRQQVSHLWLVDPEAKTVEILRLDGESYRLVVTLGDVSPVRAEPFDAIEFDIDALWSR